jgi:hypothetical protein
MEKAILLAIAASSVRPRPRCACAPRRLTPLPAGGRFQSLAEDLAGGSRDTEGVIGTSTGRCQQ